MRKGVYRTRTGTSRFFRVSPEDLPVTFYHGKCSAIRPLTGKF